jgi:hypothetical protein
MHATMYVQHILAIALSSTRFYYAYCTTAKHKSTTTKNNNTITEHTIQYSVVTDASNGS